jgi:hypothetical protein
MILHVVSLFASLANAAPQQQVPVQCVLQPPPDSWLMPIIQTVVSLASITAGVCIAVASFRANKRAEHEQWIRDQKRAEWRELLIKIAEIEHEIPILVTGLPDHQKLEPIVLSILPPLRGTLFVYSTLESSGFIAKWELFVQYVSGRFMSTTRINRSVQTGTLGDPVSLDDIERWNDMSTKEEIEVRNRLHTLLGELRDLAHRSLEMKDKRL